MSEKLSSETFDNFVNRNPLPVLVDFYRDGCLPCRRIAPLLSRSEEEYKELVSFAKANLDTSDDLAQRFAVTAAPTLILFRNGKEIERRSGAVSFDELKQFIETVL